MDELARKAARVDPAMAPGLDAAVHHGCRCSVLFKDEALVDPLCPLHGSSLDLERLGGPSR
ncbi:hypothetical protein [Actinomycetospora sp. TBRC 11914]|uniref:hypothetical protein n=1 Tax=Actinomycetospora sp. TBRC 11914 TaxID=2729387 RepID=UPI00145EAC8C|nr:hypothetical protein [Actinomycetospora sp. TBRC 11914]NMO90912.1 hypothetical protein [Actinomycetospora sp. TBRC 11914]